MLLHWRMFLQWGNKLCVSPNAVQVGMPPALSSDTSACPLVWLGSVGVLCQALEARKCSVGIIRMRIKIRKDDNGVTVATTLFTQVKSRLQLRTLLHLAP